MVLGLQSSESLVESMKPANSLQLSFQEHRFVFPLVELDRFCSQHIGFEAKFSTGLSFVGKESSSVYFRRVQRHT